MTRRTHACLGCSGSPGDTPLNKPRRTRHKDRICAICRRRGITHRDGILSVPLTLTYRGRDA